MIPALGSFCRKLLTITRHNRSCKSIKLVWWGECLLTEPKVFFPYLRYPVTQQFCMENNSRPNTVSGRLAVGGSYFTVTTPASWMPSVSTIRALLLGQTFQKMEMVPEMVLLSQISWCYILKLYSKDYW